MLDASILLFFLDANTPASVERAADRVEYLIHTLSKAGERIIIPTPVLSECLVGAGEAGPDYLAIIHKQTSFRVAPFDERAAVEAAARVYEARRRGLLRGGSPEATKAKIKFDRMIVAIAAVERATTVYSDDHDVCKYSREAGIDAFRLHELPLPPEDPQTSLPLSPPGS